MLTIFGESPSQDMAAIALVAQNKQSPEGDPQMTSYETTSNPATVQAWNNLAHNWVFACPVCGEMGIVITERLFWYSCRHCGYELASMKPQEPVRSEVVNRSEGLAQAQL
jgi:rubredoxin